MQRSKSLIPLSHDHYHGLVLCRRIKEGLNDRVDPQSIVLTIQNFWRNELKQHLQEEEKFVFPLLPKAEANIQQALNEHQRLRAQIAIFSSDSITDVEDTLRDFARLLEEHIRFEERVLFSLKLSGKYHFWYFSLHVAIWERKQGQRVRVQWGNQV